MFFAMSLFYIGCVDGNSQDFDLLGILHLVRAHGLVTSHTDNYVTWAVNGISQKVTLARIGGKLVVDISTPFLGSVHLQVGTLLCLEHILLWPSVSVLHTNEQSKDGIPLHELVLSARLEFADCNGLQMNAVRDLILAVSLLQMLEAADLAEKLALVIGAKRLGAAGADSALGVIAGKVTEVLTVGVGKSLDYQEVFGIIKEVCAPTVEKVNSFTLSASIPTSCDFTNRSGSAIVHATNIPEHPRIGHTGGRSGKGLWLQLAVPVVEMDHVKGLRLAIHLNGKHGFGLGSYCYAACILYHSVFIPEALASNSLVRAVLLQYMSFGLLKGIALDGVLPSFVSLGLENVPPYKLTHRAITRCPFLHMMGL